MIKRFFHWIWSSADKSKQYSRGVYENVSAPESCGWLQDVVAKLSWLDVTNLFILSTFLIRLPFLVRYFTSNKLDTGKARCLHVDDRCKFLLPLFALFAKIGTLYLANTGALPAWSQFPVNDTVAKFGVLLGVVSLFSLLWIHCSLSASWSCCVAALKDQKLRVEGAYKYARHPLYVTYLLHSVAVFLISQNWLLGAAAVPWLAYSFSKVKREEVLMIEMFGQAYLDYMTRVPAFGPMCKCEFGLTENERQAALKMHQEKQAIKGEQSGAKKAE